MDTLGQVAYEAYRASTGGVSLVSGDRLPSWEDQAPEIQAAWEAGAQAAVAAYIERIEGRHG